MLDRDRHVLAHIALHTLDPELDRYRVVLTIREKLGRRHFRGNVELFHDNAKLATIDLGRVTPNTILGRWKASTLAAIADHAAGAAGDRPERHTTALIGAIRAGKTRFVLTENRP